VENSSSTKKEVCIVGFHEDIAKAAVFLASDDAAWITGEQISVSGGIYGF